MIFIKPDGREIQVNENSREAAIALGWKPKESAVEVAEVPTSPRRGRPPKVKHDDNGTAGS